MIYVKIVLVTIAGVFLGAVLGSFMAERPNVKTWVQACENRGGYALLRRGGAHICLDASAVLSVEK